MIATLVAKTTCSDVVANNEPAKIVPFVSGDNAELRQQSGRQLAVDCHHNRKIFINKMESGILDGI